MHVAEAGTGTPVILCHGFPHLWYSWRHQLPALASAGYRVIAPDLRGYGRTSAPADVAAYDSGHVCGDITGLIEACGVDRPVLVGLDFGAQLVWELALRQPERLRAVIVLNNPYTGRSRRRPSEVFAATARDHFLHLHYFQQPGPADAELAARPRGVPDPDLLGAERAGLVLQRVLAPLGLAAATSTYCRRPRRCPGRG